jgi:hypothetical protein
MNCDIFETIDIIQDLIWVIKFAEIFGEENEAIRYEAELKCYQYHLNSLI